MSDDKEKLNKDEDEAGEFSGPMSDRGCTDIVFLLLFLAFLVGMGIISGIAYSEGNIHLLIRGYDSYGNVCGHENEKIEGIEYSGLDMRGKGNLLYLNPMDLSTKEYVKAVCVDKCPDETYITVDSIPVEYCLPGAEQGDEKLCPDVPLYESSPILHRCTPVNLEDIDKEVSKQIEKITNGVGTDALETFATEVERSWREIVYIILVGLGASLLMLVLIRFLAALFVYIVYLAVFVGCIGGTTFLWVKYKKEKEELDSKPKELQLQEDEDNVTAFLIYAIVATVASVILLLVMIAMWSRVKLVIALFKEAGEVVMTMPLLIVQPVYTLIAVGLFLAYWASALLYIASVKDPVQKNTTDGVFIKYVSNDDMKNAFWYHLFGLFWVTQFIVACQLMIIAGAVAAWYFTRDKSNLGWFPILNSFYRTVRYHLGTLAFGSLIIAIVQFITAVLTYIQAKLGKSDNVVAQLILKCMFCCLWCLETLFKFINRNAYIMTAIYGYHFCKAAKRGFELLLSNALRVAAINTVGDFCLFLAKILIVTIVIMAGIGICGTNKEIEIEAIPIALGALATYIIAHVFLSVYEMVVDTVFLCFCEDSERNDGSAAKPYYMSDNLKDFVDTTEEALKKQKEKKDEKKKLVDSADNDK